MIVTDYINDTICEVTDNGQEQDALLAAVMRGKVTLTYSPDIDALHLHRAIPVSYTHLRAHETLR